MLPVYQWNQPKAHYPLESLVSILLVESLPTEKICSKQPVNVCKNVSFVVDLHMLDDPADIRADENGVWKRKGSPVAYISLHTEDGETSIFRRKKMATKPSHFKVTRTYYRHTSSPDFTRVITVIHGTCEGSCMITHNKGTTL